jgi:chromate reductase
MSATRQLLLISGSLRTGSTNSAIVLSAAAAAPEDVEVTVYDGLAGLPHFNPDDDAEGVVLPPSVIELRAAIGRADAVVFSTPEYAGALPGSFKNLLDWTVGGGEMDRKPVAWINASERGAVNAHESLRRVLGYLSVELLEANCVQIPVPRHAVGDDGLISDPEIRVRVTEALASVRDALNASA